jgi:hypothetical protein
MQSLRAFSPSERVRLARFLLFVYIDCRRVSSADVFAQVTSLNDYESEEDEYSDVYEVLSNKTSKIVLEGKESPSIAAPSPTQRRDRTGARGDSRQNARMSVIIQPGAGAQSAPHIHSTTRRPQPLKKYALDDFQLLKVLGKGSFGKVCDINVVGLDVAAI